MDGYRDLHLLVSALRDRAVDPARLADAVGDWDPKAGPSLFAVLAAKGVLSAGDLHRFEAATVDAPTAVRNGVPPLEYTQIPHVGDDDPTTDHRRGRGEKPPPQNSDGTHPQTAERYRVLKHHQSGGLGRVWLAHDAVVGRDVAVKTLRTDRAPSRATRARFVREAKVTGRLEHPSIVPLYDLAGGEQPYYVMRFVSGRTLAEAAEDYHRRRAEKTAAPLDLFALLDAFVHVCRAVAFAHARGILHRDLKGQNVVLGEYGEVFLLDWGLAKYLGDPGGEPSANGVIAGEDETSAGSVVGTPAFMAPEIAAGGAATKAADVYGLGALLYSLLTGGPPYAGVTATAVLDAVTASAPEPILSVNPAAPKALAAICGKAMARAAADRYPSADDLATDVRRWLADEPVSAYREPAAARAARWARRHRTAVISAGVLLITTAIAASIAAGLLWREEQKTAAARDAVQKEWDRAEREKTRAEANFGLAWGVASDLGSVIDANETVTAPNPVTLAARKALLSKAVGASEQFLAAQPDDPDTRERAARLLRTSANLARVVGDSAAADRDYRASIRLWEGLAEQFPADAVRQADLAHTLRTYAMLQMRAGRHAAAAESLNRALRTAAAAPDPDPVERDWTLALVYLDSADLECERERYKVANDSAARAVEHLDAHLAARTRPPHPLAALFRAITSTRLAIARRGAGDTTGALTAHDDAVERFRKLLAADDGPDTVHTYCRALTERARTAATIEARRAEAAKDLDDAVRRWEDLARQYPQTAMYRERLADAMIFRAGLRTTAARRDKANPAALTDAERDLKAALDRLEKLAKGDPAVPAYRGLLGDAWTGLARLAADTKTLDPAVDRALSSYRAARNLAPDAPRFPRALDAVTAEFPEAAKRSAEKRKAAAAKP